MNNNIVTLQKTDGIYDIQPLVEPAHSTFEITILFISTLLFTTIIYYFLRKYFFSRKAVSKRRILKLQAQYLNNNISVHDAAYDLCQHLNDGFNVKHINTKTPLPNKISSHNKEWRFFTKKISDLRYKYNSCRSIDINELFKESFLWLKLWP